jgi:hypothetical protein
MPCESSAVARACELVRSIEPLASRVKRLAYPDRGRG